MRLNDPVYMKQDVPDHFVFGKPFLTSAQLSKRPFPLRRLHNWYMSASSLGVRNVTVVVPENAFWSGAKKVSIEFEDLWLMFHKRWLDINLLLVWCLYVLTCSFYVLNTLVFLLSQHVHMIFVCRMQFMDGEKVGQKCTVGILDPTRISQASFTANLSKNSEYFRNKTQKEFNKEVAKKTSERNMEVATYIARAIDNFVKDGKTLIKIPYFFE